MSRGVATLIVTGVVLLSGVLSSAQDVQAHGAPWSPISRGAACAPDNARYGDSPACRAAQAASPAGALEAWDNMRRKGVEGRHRSFVPDGELCGAGLEDFRGLNLARSDWPATIVNSGSDFTFKFLATIPHQGRFKLYITRNDYDPSVPLRWSDLEPEPFVDVEQPPMVDSAYRFDARLPAGKSGRHVIFTIWENTTLPDTYYSCSDVVFRGAGGTFPPSPAPSATGNMVEAGASAPTVTLPDPTSAGVKSQASTPLAATAEQGLQPIAKASGIVSSSPQGRLFMTLAGMLAMAAVLVVLVLTYFIKRQGRRRS
ncbi:lytic polysaccharide monooxygenase auxiliary activity family 9 protein [Streptomyces sp. NPDC005125]